MRKLFQTLLLWSIVASITHAQKPILQILKENQNSEFKEGVHFILNKKYDSAKGYFNKELQNQNLKSEQSDFINLCIGAAQHLNGDMEDAIKSFKKVSKNFKYLCTTSLLIGKNYQNLGKIDSINKYADLCIKNCPNFSQGYSLKKEYYQLTYQFDKALIYAHKSLKLDEEYKDDVQISGSLCDIGNVWIGLNDYKKALSYFNQSLELHQKKGFTDNLFLTYIGIIDSYREMGDLPKSLEFITKAERLFHTVPQHKAGEIILRKGFTYSLMGKNNEAIDSYQNALKIFEKAQKQAFIANTYILLGRLQFETKDYANAEKNLLKGKEVAENNRIAGMQQNAIGLLYDLYEQKQDYKNAFTYLKRFKALEDSSFTIEKENQISELSTKYETEKKEAQNKLLSAEVKSAQFKQKLYLIIGAILAIFLVIVVFLGLRLKKLNFKLNDSLVEIRKYSETIEKMFTIISHDIRSPLNTYQRYTEIVGYLVRNKQFDRLDKTLSQIDELGLHLSTLLNNLLQWSISQQKKDSISLKEVNIKTFFESLMPIYREMSKLKSITLVEEHAEQTITTDPNSFGLIVRNLLDNALKYTPEGEKVSLQTFVEQNNLVFQIKNKSFKMDNVQVNKIKELFDGIKEYSFGEDGLGVGLILINQFAKQIKSTILFEQNPDGLTTFKLSLPLVN